MNLYSKLYKASIGSLNSETNEGYSGVGGLDACVFGILPTLQTNELL
jgi:hypothetical protein